VRVNVKYWLECVMLRHVHVACFQCCSGFKSAIYTSIYHDFLKHNCVRLYTHMLWLWHLQYVAGHTQCSTESASGIVASQVWWNVPGVHCSSQVCWCAHCTSARYDDMCQVFTVPARCAGVHTARQLGMTKCARCSLFQPGVQVCTLHVS